MITSIWVPIGKEKCSILSPWTMAGRPRSRAASRRNAAFLALLSTRCTAAPRSPASAQAITGASGTVNGSNVSATKEAGEPNHAGNAGGHSIWFTWVPQAGGATTVKTAGSSFDTLLAVYTGSAVGALSQVAANDDADGALQSRVGFTAAAGTAYRIAVDGYGGGTGNVTLTWSQP